LNGKRLAVILIAILIVVTPLSYVGYALHSYDKLINPGTPKGVEKYTVIYSAGQFYILTEEQYNELIKNGTKLPESSQVFNVTLKSYLTGSPKVDLNMTLRSFYDYFTIVLGAPSVIHCKDNPGLYGGNCQYRTLAASEISGVVSNLFSVNYYLKGREMGYDNATARQYAFNQTWMRFRKTYLNFWTKLDIGRGKIGNEKNLAVLLIGPAEGARENAVFVPRKGLLVIEGTTDETLRAEIVLIENVIGFQWPEGNQTRLVQVTG